MFQDFLMTCFIYIISVEFFTLFFKKNRDSSDWNYIKKRIMSSRVLGTFIIVLYLIIIVSVFIMLDKHLNKLYARAILGGIILGFTKSIVGELTRK